MITSWDDYPVHQTPLPVAHPESGDPAHYERYWFGFFDTAATTAVGFGLSLYPNLGVIDAAFSVARGGRQESLFASGAMDPSRSVTRVGPLSVEVVEPLRALRVVADTECGLGGDLMFSAVTNPLEEPRSIRSSGTRVTSDRTRLVQFGSADGRITVDGVDLAVDSTSWRAVRDRSWGIRATHGSAAAVASPTPPSSWFVWNVLHFDDECVHAVWHEDPDGSRIGATGAVLPVKSDEPVRKTSTLDCDITYRPGTRWVQDATLRLGPRGAVERAIRIEPRVLFLQKGLGYSHPDHRFGAWHGGTVVARETWRESDLDPSDRANLHQQMLSVLHRDDGAVGVGLFEHAAVGRHAPSGLG